MSLAPSGRLLVHTEKPPPGWLVREGEWMDRLTRERREALSLWRVFSFRFPFFLFLFFRREGGGRGICQVNYECG